MKQVIGSHFNPFKKGPRDDDSRWFHINRFYANRFLWEQVLSGDGGDMPIDATGAGIEGVGPATAAKMTDNNDTFGVIIEREYTKKYGAEKGFLRAQITYKMVRLLDGSDTDAYAGAEALEEIREVKRVFREYVVEVSNDVGALFGIKSAKGSDLFS
jgi:hypothetical protein